MTETLAYEYSSESTHRELSNEYQHDRVSMVYKNICVFVLWTKEASVFEGLTLTCRQLPIIKMPYKKNQKNKRCLLKGGSIETHSKEIINYNPNPNSLFSKLMLYPHIHFYPQSSSRKNSHPLISYF